MQVLILAAGMATRLRPHTQKTPKCLLEVGGQAILKRMLTHFINTGLKEFVIVVGYEKEKIKTYVKTHFPKEKFTFIENKDYATTNNAYSLLLAKEAVVGDFILSDSDICFEQHIIKDLLDYEKKPCLAIKKQKWDKEAIKVSLREDNSIITISKEVPEKESYGESIGIEVFPKEQAKLLFQTLEKRIIQENRVNEFYEASFQEMIDQGLLFYAVDIKESLATEIDDESDLNNARNLF